MQGPNRTRTRAIRGFCYRSKGSYAREIFWFTHSTSIAIGFRIKLKL